MRRRSSASIALVLGLSAAGLGVLFVGCDAGGGAGGTATTEGNGPSTSVAGGSDPGAGGADSGAGGDDVTVTSSVTVTVGTTTSTASTGSGQNPCGTECGPEELCDGVHQGLDDNCDGTVDEGCPCNPGQANDCFKGDPSYRQSEGCFPGTMRCSEFGQWGSCDGGAHAWGDEPCQEGSLEGCHAITAVPFQVVNLKSGTGVFSDGADAESWTVECPEGIEPCPAVSGANPQDDFQPLQSGEYTVTYTKTVDGQEESCTYPLYVGARGLRVEITWNFPVQTDLDLHMLQPGLVGPINRAGDASDCGYNNCTIDDFQSGSGYPEWFPLNAPPGDPVAWYLDPVQELNSCYFAPRGVGQEWRDLGRGCHNPRLDLDNISCDPSATDVNDSSFCAPENINIDFPPQDQWIRVGVVHYSGSPQQPTMKIFCDGALKAVLGPEGFNAPVNLSSGVWIAADVAFVEDECSSECVVSPVFQDPNAQTPFITGAPATGPAFPPLPTPGG
ncbi:MAG TPA: hypothetical protein VGE43_08230 [Acidimicrobiales bacterium]